MDIKSDGGDGNGGKDKTQSASARLSHRALTSLSGGAACPSRPLYGGDGLGVEALLCNAPPMRASSEAAAPLGAPNSE